MSTLAFVHIDKLKTNQQLATRGNHNMHLGSDKNADPEKTALKQSLVPIITKEDGTMMTYVEAFNKRVSELPYYQDKNLRRDQVRGLDVLITFSHDESIDIKKWCAQSMAWLHDTFDVAQDQKSNIVNAELHVEETGNVHIHAFVIPIDAQGHLNASGFMKRKNLIDIQTSYAKYVANLGIERGVEGSSANHKTIRKMYANLNQAVEIPSIIPGETAEEYRKRVTEELETRFAGMYREAEEQANKRRRSVDQYVHEQKELLRIKKKEAAEAEANVEEARKKVEEVQEAISYYKEQNETLLKEIYQLQGGEQNIEEIEAREKRYRRMSKGLEILSEKDPERAQEFMDSCAEAEKIGAEWELEQNEQEGEVN